MKSEVRELQPISNLLIKILGNLDYYKRLEELTTESLKKNDKRLIISDNIISLFNFLKG